MREAIAIGAAIFATGAAIIICNPTAIADCTLYLNSSFCFGKILMDIGWAIMRKAKNGNLTVGKLLRVATGAAVRSTGASSVREILRRLRWPRLAGRGMNEATILLARNTIISPLADLANSVIGIFFGSGEQIWEATKAVFEEPTVMKDIMEDLPALLCEPVFVAVLEHFTESEKVKDQADVAFQVISQSARIWATRGNDLEARFEISGVFLKGVVKYFAV